MELLNFIAVIAFWCSFCFLLFCLPLNIFQIFASDMLGKLWAMDDFRCWYLLSALTLYLIAIPKLVELLNLADFIITMTGRKISSCSELNGSNWPRSWWYDLQLSQIFARCCLLKDFWRLLMPWLCSLCWVLSSKLELETVKIDGQRFTVWYHILAAMGAVKKIKRA